VATFEITKVRTEKSASETHEHISMVELNGKENLRFSRSIIVKDLKDPSGDRYYTYAGGERADVILVECPTCTFGDYITTAPDTTTANNLLKLPRF
jgi:Protein of unknown function (DUF3892)